MNRKYFLITCAIVVAALMGCGGGSSNFQQATGRVVLEINWPSRAASRLVPLAANSLTFIFSDSLGRQRHKETFARTTSGAMVGTYTIKNLPVGDLKMDVTAYPDSYGTGVGQAKGSITITIKSQQDTKVAIEPATTIVRAALTSPNGTTVAVGSGLDLIAQCFDFRDQQVITVPDTEQYKSSDTSIATVDRFGTVTGVKNGNVTIMYTETESKVTASIGITVGDKQKYTISGNLAGGQFTVDDDLDVFVNGRGVYTDNYSLGGFRKPFVIQANKGDTLRFTVRATSGHCASLSPLFISDGAGHSQQIDAGFNLGCGLPGGDNGIVYDKSATIPF